MKHIPVMVAAVLVGCDSASLEASNFDGLEYTNKVVYKNGKPSGGYVPALNLEDCDNRKDDDGDGKVDGEDPDCDGSTLGGDVPPGYGGDTGQGPNTFIPWDDFFFSLLENSQGSYWLANTSGELETPLTLAYGDDGDRALESLMYYGEGEAYQGFVLDGIQTEGLEVQLVHDERSGLVWTLLKDHENDLSWGVTGPGAFVLAPPQQDRR